MDFDASIFDQVALPRGEDRPDTEDDFDGDEPAPQREGLPPGFRMRHDAHYVEALISAIPARTDAPVVSQDETARPRNGDRAPKAAVTMTMTDASAEIGQSLDAIGACLRLFPNAPRPATERLALELIGAEVCRATWLLQALSLLHDEPPVANLPVDLASVASRVQDGLTIGTHRSGRALEVRASAPGLRTIGDGPLITVAVAGMVMALQAVAERVEPAVIEVALREESGRVLVVATQEAVRIPAAWRARFLDAAWTDRPGGRRVAVGLAAAQRAAALHHGTLTLADGERGGCRLVLSLPRA